MEEQNNIILGIYIMGIRKRPELAQDAQPGDLLGGPVIKNSSSSAGDEGLIPGQGTTILHVSG